MLYRLILAVLHRLGLHTRAEYDQLQQAAATAVEAAALETARATIYAAALIHNERDEPHLTGDADKVYSHAEQWLHGYLGRGSGDVIDDAPLLLAAIDQQSGRLDETAAERIHDALADIDDTVVRAKAILGHPVPDGHGPTKARGIDDHWMDDLIGRRS